MRCTSCEFENIPGLKRCARCNASLTLGDIDYEPPRASGSVVLRRTRYRMAGSANRFGFGLAGLFRKFRLPVGMTGASLGSLVMSVLPGMGQVLISQRTLGWSLFGAWCVLMGLSLFEYGASAGDWWRALAVMVHATAIALALKPGVTRLGWGSRLMLGIGLVIVLNLTLYRAVNWATQGFAGALTVNNVNDTEIAQNDDRFLYTGRWLRPEPFERGDLVAYRIERGLGVDRVVGLAGETVRIEGGRVLVDGQPITADEMPLNGVDHFPDITFRVEEGQYLILPSNLAWRVAGNDQQRLLEQMLRRNCLVDESDISGRVFWRVRPLSRFESVE